jgi:predicted RNA-binding protein YlxR (DUF448 family)
LAKKIPLRKCILTNEMYPKKELIRIVVTKEGDIFVDPTGKKNGRGSYVVKDLDKVQNARQKKVLEKKLGKDSDSLTPVYDEIIRLIYREDIPKR